MAYNKVIYDGTTLIDLTEDTAVASDVASGKTFHLASGVIAIGTASGGGGGGLVDTVTQLQNGGDLHTITGIDLSSDTVSSVTLLQGYTAHDSSGQAIIGSYEPATLITKTITQNGTYSAEDDDADGYSEVTVNVSGGGDTSDFKSVIERTATTPTLPSDLTMIGQYAFYSCTNLALTSLPSSVTSIGNYAFYQCTNLALTSLPSGLISIGTNAFNGCTNLALTSLPSSVTSVESYAFYQCTNLALTSLPSGLISIGTNAFYRCTNLALTSLPSGITSIGSYAFNGCTSLINISCEGAISSLGSSSFLGASTHPMNLKSVRFPNMTVSSLSTAFGSTTAANACKQLELADIGSAKAIAANAFANCYALETLVLRRSDAICTLSNVSAFTNTPMSGYSSLVGKVYVPSDLISTYQTATNWSTLYGGGTLTFEAIEGSEYEL